MVEVQLSRAALEALASEGTVCENTRLDVQAASSHAGTAGVEMSRFSIEVLASEPPKAAVTRADISAASDHSGTAETYVSRISVEVLASEVFEAAVTRLDTSVAADHSAATEALLSRFSIEALARQGSAGPVTPLSLANDSHVFLHNWVSKAEITSSFRNSVHYSPSDGAESRRGISLKPFRSMRLEWMVCPGTDLEDLERIEVALRRLTDLQFQVPVYPDQKELAVAHTSSDSVLTVDTTKARFFPGARIAVVQIDKDFRPTTFNYYLIDSMTNTSITLDSTLGVDVPAGSLVFPVMDCEVALEVTANYTTARVPTVRLTVIEVPGASQLPPIKSDNPVDVPVFEGRPVWTLEPDWTEGVAKGRVRHGSRGDSGRADYVSVEAERSRQTHQMDIVGQRDRVWGALEFFETRRGRLRSFWHTDQDQYMETVSVDASGTFVSVSEVGNLTDFSEEFDYVGIVMDDGEVFVREVSSIQQILTVFRITMSTAIPAGYTAANVLRVARARLTRFDSDSFTESWHHTNLMNCSVGFVEVLNEDNYSI